MDKISNESEISYFNSMIQDDIHKMSEFKKYNSFFENFIPAWSQ